MAMGEKSKVGFTTFTECRLVQKDEAWKTEQIVLIWTCDICGCVVASRERHELHFHR